MKCLFTILVLSSFSLSYSQDSTYARKIVDTLTSPYFWGRGYTRDGMHRAASYIEDQFKQAALKPLSGNSFLQHFAYPVNTFPGRMTFSLNRQLLTPGIDYIVSPDAKGIHAAGTLAQADSTHFINPNYRVVLSFEDKLTWSVAPEASDVCGISILRKYLKDLPYLFNIDIQNKVEEDFKAANICAIVKGTAQPDSFLFITAHYDHLGGMGKDTYFPGANDNASGVSLLLSLANYYSRHPQPYSIAFICFAGEEAGLIGSKYYTEHPLVPLSNIKFLLNLDLEGTGEEGITVVNSTEYPQAFAAMNKVNDSCHCLVKINPRGKAANSDHYWFSEKGVPAFFFYTLGGIKAYHDIYDRSATLPMNKYNDLFKLVTGFFRNMQSN